MKRRRKTPPARRTRQSGVDLHDWERHIEELAALCARVDRVIKDVQIQFQRTAEIQAQVDQLRREAAEREATLGDNRE